MSIGKNITMFRKAKGFTQAELGELPFVSSLLIWTLVGIWLLLFVYIVLNTLKSKKNRN